MAFLRDVLAISVISLLVWPSRPTAQKFSDWIAPVNLGAVVNSSATDAAPAISKDGRSLYFNSNRSGGIGGADLWVSQWDYVAATWGSPVNLGSVVNTNGIEAGPALSRDEHWLFFQSNRNGNMDIWVSYRTHIYDNFAWEPAVNLGSGVNSTFEESMGGYFEGDEGAGPQIFFSSNRPGLGGFDLYSSAARADGTFGPATLIMELSSSVADPGMRVSFNGLEAFFFSARPGGRGGQDLWTATREAVNGSWSVPVNLGALVNSSTIDQGPYLASDRQTLFFGSDRPGGLGGTDLYVTTRTGPGAR
jgi:Tol biopolymer transport system component